MRVFLSSLFLMMLVFSGCNNSAPAPQKSNNERPSWILNPNQDGKTGAVGIADFHIKGLSFQKDLAAKRARVELSESQGVTIVSKSKFKESYSSDGRSNSSVSGDSTFKSSSVVTAHIQEVWQDKMSEKMYVWMVLDN